MQKGIAFFLSCFFPCVVIHLNFDFTVLVNISISLWIDVFYKIHLIFLSLSHSLRFICLSCSRSRWFSFLLFDAIQIGFHFLLLLLLLCCVALWLWNVLLLGVELLLMFASNNNIFVSSISEHKSTAPIIIIHSIENVCARYWRFFFASQHFMRMLVALRMKFAVEETLSYIETHTQIHNNHMLIRSKHETKVTRISSQQTKCWSFAWFKNRDRDAKPRERTNRISRWIIDRCRCGEWSAKCQGDTLNPRIQNKWSLRITPTGMLDFIFCILFSQAPKWFVLHIIFLA